MHNFYYPLCKVSGVKVSIIVATYSSAMFEHFKECIKSLLRQTYEDIEIIVIVDGDKEYYKQILTKLATLINTGTIRVYLNEKNVGLAESRNRGVELANGDVVAFIDDDAVADERWIEELVKMYEQGAIAAGGKLVPLWIAKKPKWLPEEFYWLIGATHLGFPEKVTEVRNTFGSNISFQKETFVNAGGFRSELGVRGRAQIQAEEADLCERMRIKFGKGVIYNPKAIVYHKIFDRRTKLSFLINRAFWQGYSKAVMSNDFRRIGEETDFLKYLVLKRTGTRLRAVLNGSYIDLTKLILLWVFMFIVGVGYFYGRALRQKSYLSS